MYKKNYLEDINKEIFPMKKRNTKHIHNAKPGDTVIYRGGYGKEEEELPSASFTKGKEYIVEGINKESKKNIFKTINKIPIDGHISIKKDDSGSHNGWGAALFELVEKQIDPDPLNIDEWRKLCEHGVIIEASYTNISNWVKATLNGASFNHDNGRVKFRRKKL